MVAASRLWTVLLANTLLVASLVVFAIGFFPYKASLPGLAEWRADSLRPRGLAPFDKVIFMVVDALRSDFVYGNESKFLFTQQLIRDGAAIPFTGHASPPTITMPRVKAITTGSVPSFFDLVLNFAESDTTSTLATQDSWLAQMRSKDSGKLVMYGDDTWLRLFPGFFDRFDGTTSFFVSDFTEVDNNVTRNVVPELELEDWSVMVLHFLGLDHIGHKTGPKGPNMPAKQAEMDGIVQMIYHAMTSQKQLAGTLLVLLGDHGMNEAGNHGASSAGEVSTALTFVSDKFKSLDIAGFPSPAVTGDVNKGNYQYYDLVEQSDIAPTLAALLGFPVSSNNLGVLIPTLMGMWPWGQNRYALWYENGRQMSEIAKATFPSAFETDYDDRVCSDLADPEELACLWSLAQKGHTDNPSQYDTNTISMVKFLQKAQRTLSGTASNYDTRNLLFGIALAVSAAGVCVVALEQGPKITGLGKIVFPVLAWSYGGTMFASSYVEEEHQFWYWATAGWLAVLYKKAGRREWKQKVGARLGLVLVCLLYGIIRRWKQTGQKYAGDPDLLSEVLTPSPFILWLLVIAAYSVFSRNLSRRATSWLNSKQMGVLPVLVSMSALVFKIAFTTADAPEIVDGVAILQPLVLFTSKYPLISLAHVCFLGLGQMLLCAIYYEAPWTDRAHLKSFLRAFQEVTTLFLITQTRASNIPLFLIFHIQMRLLEKFDSLTVTEISITSILFQFSSFFAFGGTNAISSVDLSNAYNGISGYNVSLVGILTFISNWAGPIWWTIATCELLTCVEGKAVSDAAFEHFVMLTTFIVDSTAFVMIACYVLREHLFIWTVFSPKYLYQLAWVFGQHLVINGMATLGMALFKEV